MIDMLFRTDAGALHGLGHLARCLRLASHVRESRPNIEISLQGAFDRECRSFIAVEAPWAHVAAPEESVVAKIAVIDRLADPEDAESWDDTLAEELVGDCGRVVAILSGKTDPVNHPLVRRIGYQPGGPAEAPPLRLWGLRFAPGLIATRRTPAGELSGAGLKRLLVAFGGGATSRSYNLLLAALPFVDAIDSADILISPIADSLDSPTATSAGQALRWHRGTRDVRGLIEGADVVLASFGNLAYEALSLGRPVCYMNQKRFQTELADEMVRIGLAESAGDAALATPDALSDALWRTLGRGNGGAQDVPALDGRGIERIGAILCETLDSLGTLRCASSA
jgi:hypothetical protein